MPGPQTPISIRHEISVQQIGTETLVYDGRRHMAFCLNEISSVVWRLADGIREIPQIREAAAQQLSAPVSDELVLFTVDELRRDGLIEPSAEVQARPVISRRAMLLKLGAGGAMLLPAITAIVAPTPAQAYSGCVDCTNSSSARAARAARARRLQQSTAPASAPTGSPEN